MHVLISVVERDMPALGIVRGDSGLAPLQPFARALEEAGLYVLACHEATAADVAKRGSAWAKRLGIPARRPAWVLTATRPPLPAGA